MRKPMVKSWYTGMWKKLSVRAFRVFGSELAECTKNMKFL